MAWHALESVLALMLTMGVSFYGVVALVNTYKEGVRLENQTGRQVRRPAAPPYPSRKPGRARIAPPYPARRPASRFITPPYPEQAPSSRVQAMDEAA